MTDMNRRNFIKFLGASTAIAAADIPIGRATGAAGTEAARGSITMTLQGWRAAGQPMYVYDAAVFGGGFSGLGAAFELARRGQRVLIVERGAALDPIGNTFWSNLPCSLRMESHEHPFSRNHLFKATTKRHINESANLDSMHTLTAFFVILRTFVESGSWLDNSAEV